MDKAKRMCPECGSSSYLFRGRKTVETKGKSEVETKYRCKECEHLWTERVPVKERV